MTPTVAERSPWQAALGDRFNQLHPRLVAYFGAIPAGQVGRGTGVFDVVGTPRRWLWPVLGLLGAAHVIFPVWERDVPFAVENRRVDAALHGARTFRFARHPRVMRDVISHRGDHIVDRLGPIEAELAPRVVDGGLELRSVRTRMLGVPIPRAIAPQLTLTERVVSGQQFVELTLDHPWIGRIYEYRGRFSYRVEQE